MYVSRSTKPASPSQCKSPTPLLIHSLHTPFIMKHPSFSYRSLLSFCILPFLEAMRKEAPLQQLQPTDSLNRSVSVSYRSFSRLFSVFSPSPFKHNHSHSPPSPNLLLLLLPMPESQKFQCDRKASVYILHLAKRNDKLLSGSSTSVAIISVRDQPRPNVSCLASEDRLLSAPLTQVSKRGGIFGL